MTCRQEGAGSPERLEFEARKGSLAKTCMIKMYPSWKRGRGHSQQRRQQSRGKRYLLQLQRDKGLEGSARKGKRAEREQTTARRGVKVSIILIV
jgi:hypothetical protein